MWILKLLLIFYYHFLCFAEHGGHTDSKSYIFGIMPTVCLETEFLNGVAILYAEQTTQLYVFGYNLTQSSVLGFTNEDNCDYPIPSELKLSDSYRGVVTFTPPKRSLWSLTKYYTCLKNRDETVWRHQGTGKHVTLYVYMPLFTTWMYIALIIMCYMLSSLMTGLNLGLMSLDNSELRLLKKAGTYKEKKYASKIIPVRRNGNFLVCSIVITATLCNAISTVAIGTFLSDVLTIVITTIFIVLFCEIFPQAVCSSYALTIGARTINITKVCMVLTFPISYPLGKVLTCIVGKELSKSYNKDRLKELLKKTHLPSHEEKIITGTLDFSNKKVEEVMTVLDDIYKLPITAVLNFEMIAAILASGYSRIPIFVGDKSNIRYVLMTKDLALLDPDDKVPVKDLVYNSKSICHYIPKGTSLDTVLGRFKNNRYHMLFVTEYGNIADTRDSKFQVNFSTADLETYEKKKENVIGLVTFEDVIEEIFQMEILDETDTVFDNREKRKISRYKKTDIISLLLQPTKVNTPSENLKLATYCFLSEVEEFSIKYLSPKVLIVVLNLDIYHTTSGSGLSQDTVYVRGVPAEYFVMILEGEMEVKIGKEEFTFEVGAFRYFGVEVLRGTSPFIPDYTLQGVKKTLYIKVSSKLYNAALLATRFERFKEVPKVSSNTEVFKYFTQIAGPDFAK